MNRIIVQSLYCKIHRIGTYIYFTAQKWPLDTMKFGKSEPSSQKETKIIILAFFFKPVDFLILELH